MGVNNLQPSTWYLPTGFVFSQSSLQDYVDCQRRFQLRYIQRRAWPALDTAPALESELFMQRGAQFHHLVHQYLLGIPVEKLARQIEGDEMLVRWWMNFTSLTGFGNLSGFNARPEISLSAPLGGFRLMAKYDVIVLPPNASPSGKGERVTIYDWKTSHKRPKREWLEKKLQTRVYPYLLARAGAQLNGGPPIEPEQIEMIYWFTDFPDQPARFAYNTEQFAADEAYLSGLIAELQSLGDGPALLTEDEYRCNYCPYRSLCSRGDKAGLLVEMGDFGEVETGFEFEFDFEGIGEIEF